MQITPFNKIASFLVAIFLFSCGVAPFDYEAAFSNNKVKVIRERIYNYEKGERVLFNETFSYLKTNGKADSVIVKITYKDEFKVLKRYFFYGLLGRLDSIRIVNANDSFQIIHSEIYHHGFVGLIDSISSYSSYRKIRNLEYRKIYSYSSTGLEKTEKWVVFPTKEIRRKEITYYDKNRKIINTKSFPNGSRKFIVESYDYQYDDLGKIVSLKIKNDRKPVAIHNYDYLPFNLRKSWTILSKEGDSLDLHLYSYEYEK